MRLVNIVNLQVIGGYSEYMLIKCSHRRIFRYNILPNN